MERANSIIERVELGERSYDIVIGSGSSTDTATGSLIAECIGNGPCLLIADAQVAALHGEAVLANLRAAGLSVELATFPAGEPSKTIQTAESLWARCAEARIDRSGTIIALGGGVSGDLAGFVAACWMRGIRFVQIPSTLLAMVDSAVGGKTGVNSTAGKNLIGAFKQPDLVVVDPSLLQTMDAREFRAGLAEVAKYGVIKDPDFFAWQESNSTALAARDEDALAEAVRVSCATKAWYVAADEREGGVRAHLNYGHTFGHALEGETGYTTYLHGEAVAIGMEMAVACAQALGMLEEDHLAERQTALLAAYGLPRSHAPADADEIDRLVDRCRIDKKVAKGKTRFVLPRRLGTVEMVSEPDEASVRAGFLSAMG